MDFRFSHDTRLYQNCERANGLDEWKLQTIIAMNTFKNSSQFSDFTQQDTKKNFADNESKKNFEVQLQK